MQRILIASVLGLFACGSNATSTPSTTPTTAVAPGTAGADDVICADEVSPTTGMTHRVCHRQSATSAETGEADVHCGNEVPTGTQMTKRICRSDAEKERDKAVARDLYLDPSARPNVDKN